MKIVHLLATGNNGGIERLVNDYSKYSKLENIFIFAWGAGSCGEKLKLRNNKVYDLDGHKLGNFNTIRCVNSIIREEDPRYVIVHHSSPLLRIISLFHKKEKVIIYQHNDPGAIFKKLSLMGVAKIIISKLALDHSCRVIAISKFVRKNLIDYYLINPNKVYIVYNGTNIEDFYFHPHAFDGTLHFVTVTRLLREKGIQNALKMLDKLSTDIEWDYTIVGDGDFKEDLMDIAQQIDINKISFLGNRDDVSEILDSKDIFLHLCDCEEGFGITIIEAMAKGKICIVSDKGALSEIITHELDGFIINNIDEGLAIVNNILSDSDKNNEVIRNANIRAKDFSICQFADQLDQFLVE